jgi:hypothetical protein
VLPCLVLSCLVVSCLVFFVCVVLFCLIWFGVLPCRKSVGNRVRVGGLGLGFGLGLGLTDPLPEEAELDNCFACVAHR